MLHTQHLRSHRGSVGTGARHRHILYDSIHMKLQTAKQICDDKAQNTGHLWRILTGKGYEGAFWRARKVLNFDLGGYTVVSIWMPKIYSLFSKFY